MRCLFTALTVLFALTTAPVQGALITPSTRSTLGRASDIFAEGLEDTTTRIRIGFEVSPIGRLNRTQLFPPDYFNPDLAVPDNPLVPSGLPPFDLGSDRTIPITSTPTPAPLDSATEAGALVYKPTQHFATPTEPTVNAPLGLGGYGGFFPGSGGWGNGWGLGNNLFGGGGGSQQGGGQQGASSSPFTPTNRPRKPTPVSSPQNPPPTDIGTGTGGTNTTADQNPLAQMSPSLNQMSLLNSSPADENDQLDRVAQPSILGEGAFGLLRGVAQNGMAQSGGFAVGSNRGNPHGNLLGPADAAPEPATLIVFGLLATAALLCYRRSNPRTA